MHSTWSDGDDSLEAMIAGAAARGAGYGVSPERLTQQRATVRAIGERYGIHTFCATEVDILPDGSLDYNDAILAELDFVIASVHSHFSQSSEAMTARLIRVCENQFVNVIGHPTGRTLDGFPGYTFDYDAVFTAAARTGTALEIDGQPNRLDLPAHLARRANELGCILTTDSDAHRVTDLVHIELAVSQARRAGLQRADILNTRSLDEIQAFVANKRRSER